MTRFQRICDAFESARQLSHDEARDEYLLATCGDDTAMLEEVRALLKQHGDAGLLDHPVERPDATSEWVQSTAGMPAKISKYKVIRKLGDGGMGVVYLAEQEHPQRLVAIKLIRPEVSTPQIVRRFELEASILARLQHPGIAQVFDAGIHDEEGNSEPYFVMEYVPGPTLHRFLEESTPTTRQKRRVDGFCSGSRSLRTPTWNYSSRPQADEYPDADCGTCRRRGTADGSECRQPAT